MFESKREEAEGLVALETPPPPDDRDDDEDENKNEDEDDSPSRCIESMLPLPPLLWLPPASLGEVRADCNRDRDAAAAAWGDKDDKEDSAEDDDGGIRAIEGVRSEGECVAIGEAEAEDVDDVKEEEDADTDADEDDGCVVQPRPTPR